MVKKKSKYKPRIRPCDVCKKLTRALSGVHGKCWSKYTSRFDKGHKPVKYRKYGMVRAT